MIEEQEVTSRNVSTTSETPEEDKEQNHQAVSPPHNEPQENPASV